MILTASFVVGLRPTCPTIKVAFMISGAHAEAGVLGAEPFRRFADRKWFSRASASGSINRRVT